MPKLPEKKKVSTPLKPCSKPDHEPSPCNIFRSTCICRDLRLMLQYLLVRQTPPPLTSNQSPRDHLRSPCYYRSTHLQPSTMAYDHSLACWLPHDVAMQEPLVHSTVRVFHSQTDDSLWYQHRCPRSSPSLRRVSPTSLLLGLDPYDYPAHHQPAPQQTASSPRYLEP